MLRAPTILNHAISTAKTLHLLPEAYLYGMAYTYASSQLRPAFLDGNWSMTGFIDFFPRAFLYKTSLGLLGLLVLAVIAIFISKRRGPTAARYSTSPAQFAAYNATPVVILSSTYALAAVTSHLNIGHRHILPVYAALYILAGASGLIFHLRSSRFLYGLVLIVLSSIVIESLVNRQRYLSFFNCLAGGPENGYKHLVDSSLDWGQDLPALAEWLLRRSSSVRQPVYLAYFGTGSPRYYGIDAISLPHADGTLLRGGTYCISATTLQQVYSRAMGKWCIGYEQVYQRLRTHTYATAQENNAAIAQPAILEDLRFARLCAALRQRVPLTTINGSILIYQLSDETVQQAVDGSPPELDNMQVAGLDYVRH